LLSHGGALELKMNMIFFFCISLSAISNQVSAFENCERPVKHFAPFTQTWIYNEQYTLLDEMNNRSLDSVVAAFAIAQIVGPWSECNSIQTLHPNFSLYWGGDNTSTFSDHIKKVQAQGKTVIASFGGYGDEKQFTKGREIAGLIEDVDQLANAYVEFIQKNNIKNIDFDIEEGGRISDHAVSKRRNDAIIKVLQRMPDLKVTYTLAVSLNGLTEDGLFILRDASQKNISLSGVNLMIMNFQGDLKGMSMADAGIQSTKKVKDQFKQEKIKYYLGLIPMIGQNDNDKVFTVEDAAKIRKFVKETRYINFLSYWSMERDTPGAKTSGKGVEGCSISFASAKNSGTNTSAGAFLEALRL
jgi:hypothetical protein